MVSCGMLSLLRYCILMTMSQPDQSEEIKSSAENCLQHTSSDERFTTYQIRIEVENWFRSSHHGCWYSLCQDIIQSHISQRQSVFRRISDLNIKCLCFCDWVVIVFRDWREVVWICFNFNFHLKVCMKCCWASKHSPENQLTLLYF